MRHPAYQKLKDTNLLPSPTGIALEILRLAGDDATTLEQIGDVVQSDPALAARLLKLVNSPFAGVERKVASVTAAVRFLGLRTVRNLALSLSLVSNNRDGRCDAFDYESFWSMSLARAVAARLLASRVSGFVPDEMFALGLLSRIGRLALATVCPVEYGELLRHAGGEQSNGALDLERRTFGLDHNELAAEMMADWQLHECFCEAVRNQDTIAPAPVSELARTDRFRRLLHVAGTFASVVTAPAPRPELLSGMSRQAADFGVPDDGLDMLFDAVVRDWRETGQILSVTTREVPSLEELRAEAYRPASCCTVDHHLPHASGASPTSAPPLHVMAVDDDPTALKLLDRCLTQAGYRVTTADNAAEALEIDRREAPQIIITDWGMPGMDGIELCRRLRRDERHGWVFILMLTANTDKGRELQALQAGADDFLGKPFTREELLAHLRVGERIIRLEATLAERHREIATFNARLADANEKLRRQATTDDLTGLTNRREVMARLEQQWAMSVRHEEPLACILADIDHFKKFNDTHGHALGDQVLGATASRLKQSARATDIVGRFGGEEFLILCPRSTRETAKVAAERMRRAVEANVIHTDGHACRVTLSFGIAERLPDMPCTQDLIKAADEALYAAKQAGRNRTCLHGENTPHARSSSA